jgi:hypothetical protein
MREEQHSVDDLSAERPPKREGSADSFPVMTDDQAKLAFNILKKIDGDQDRIEDLVATLNENVLKVLERDVDQEKSIAELKAWKEATLKEAHDGAKKTSAKYTSIGTALGVIILAASSVVMQRCQWIPPGTPLIQQTPTPK